MEEKKEKKKKVRKPATEEEKARRRERDALRRLERKALGIPPPPRAKKKRKVEEKEKEVKVKAKVQPEPEPEPEPTAEELEQERIKAAMKKEERKQKRKRDAEAKKAAERERARIEEEEAKKPTLPASFFRTNLDEDECPWRPYCAFDKPSEVTAQLLRQLITPKYWSMSEEEKLNIRIDKHKESECRCVGCKGLYPPPQYFHRTGTTKVMEVRCMHSGCMLSLNWSPSWGPKWG